MLLSSSQGSILNLMFVVLFIGIVMISRQQVSCQCQYNTIQYNTIQYNANDGLCIQTLFIINIHQHHHQQEQQHHHHHHQQQQSHFFTPIFSFSSPRPPPIPVNISTPLVPSPQGTLEEVTKLRFTTSGALRLKTPRVSSSNQNLKVRGSTGSRLPALLG